MTDEQQQEKPRPNRRRPRRGRLGFWMLVLPVLLFLFAGVAFLSLTGRPIVLPEWATARVEQIIRDQGGVNAELGTIVLEVNRRGVPRVELQNVALRAPDGASLGQFNAVRARIHPGALLDGELTAASLLVSGAQMTARRSTEGAFELRLGAGGAEATQDLPALLDAIDTALAEGILSRIGEIRVEDLTLTLEDARSGRLWQVTGGVIEMKNAGQDTQIKLIAEVFNGTEDLALAQLSFVSAKGSRAATLSTRIENAAARDIALQAPALAFLGSLDAPVSGALRAVFSADGNVESIDATLEIDEGALQPTDGAVPVGFNRGRVYLSYDPAQEKIEFSELSVESNSLRLSGRGHAFLQDFDGQWPNTILSQVHLTESRLAPEGMFESGVSFESGYADVRLRLDPFSVEFGQIVLVNEDQRVSGQGAFRAGKDGWSGRINLEAPELTPDRLLALWPVRFGSKTREWIYENVLEGRLTGIVAALRLTPGERPRIGATFGIEGAKVRFLPEMPPVEQGRAHAALTDDAFTFHIYDGVVPAGGGATIDVGGTTFQVIDVFSKSETGHLRLVANSALGPLLSILDNEPFEILSDTDLTVDSVEARAVLDAEALFSLDGPVKFEDVDFRVTGVLQNLKSDQVVPGRDLGADVIDVDVVPGMLTLKGPFRLDGLPLNVTLEQPIGPENRGRAGTIEGQIELSQASLEALRIALPEGAVTGTGTGDLTLRLSGDDGPPEFAFRSDLVGLTLRLPSVGWSKPEGTPGLFEIDGRLGPKPEIDRLQLAGPGLDVSGTVELGEDGSLTALDFSEVSVGDWLDAAVRVEPNADGGPPSLQVNGGTLDVRALPPVGPGGEGSAPALLTLDRLILSDELSLTGFQADITAGQGLEGRFAARVNGGAPISGEMLPQRGRTAFRIQGSNAGAILRDAGIFRSLDKGTLELVLGPRAEGTGFDGQMRIESTLLGDQSVIIDMLDAVSIVGIIDQMRGPGVLFDVIDARFELTDDRLVLKRASAVGASLGISLDGAYDLARKRLDMQGVLSPIYLLNSLGQALTRRGEGLFGFTFRLTGLAEKPQVSVNPLSILTPGMFREIFRRPPPGQ